MSRYLAGSFESKSALFQPATNQAMTTVLIVITLLPPILILHNPKLQRSMGQKPARPPMMMARWQPTTLYLSPSLQLLAERQTLMGLTTMYPSKTMATLRPTTLYPPQNLQVLLSEHYPPSRRRPTKAHSLMLSTPKPQTSTWLLTSKLQDFWLFIGLFSTVGRAPSTASTQFIQFSRFHAPVQHGLVSKENGTTILMTADSKEMHWMGSNSLLVLFAWWV